MWWLEHPIFYAVLACTLLQLLAWNHQRINRNADSVDLAWTLGIIICALFYLFMIPADDLLMWLVFLFPVIWYSRLLFHLLDRYRIKHEDSRYQNLRTHWSKSTQLKFLAFFMFQAGLSVLFSLPAYWVLKFAEFQTPTAIMALLVGGVALIGVAVADRQLLQFKRRHDSAKVCDIGLWHYSRHPNYFFEWLHWFVYPILLWNGPYFWWSLAVVFLMLLFLLKLTGIPFSEQQAMAHRGQAYKDYMKKTSAFILWRPKHD